MPSLDDGKQVNARCRPVHPAGLPLPPDTLGVAHPCQSLLAETAGPGSFRLSGTGLLASCIILGKSCLVPWYGFPYAGGQEQKASAEGKTLSAFIAREHLLLDANLTRTEGWRDWGMSIFPSRPSHAHSVEGLRGVVLPGGRGRSVSHYCDLPCDLGKAPVHGSSFLSSCKHSPPPPSISPSIEIQDIKQPFRLPHSEEQPERRALFSS